MDQRGGVAPGQRHPHNFERFTSPRRLMSFIGVVPGEHSSGGKRRQGAITKARNPHVRRILIEAAWNYRHRPHVGAPLCNRRKRQPARTLSIADKTMLRLHRRYQRMTLRGVSTRKAVVAMARELAGFIWAALQPLAQQSTLH